MQAPGENHTWFGRFLNCPSQWRCGLSQSSSPFPQTWGVMPQPWSTGIVFPEAVLTLSPRLRGGYQRGWRVEEGRRQQNVRVFRPCTWSKHTLASAGDSLREERTGGKFVSWATWHFEVSCETIIYCGVYLCFVILQSGISIVSCKSQFHFLWKGPLPPHHWYNSASQLDVPRPHKEKMMDKIEECNKLRSHKFVALLKNKDWSSYPSF